MGVTGKKKSFTDCKTNTVEKTNVHLKRMVEKIRPNKASAKSCLSCDHAHCGLLV